MTLTPVIRNGLRAVLVETTDGSHLMPPPEFIVIGCGEVVTGQITNWEWREILKHWQARVTASDVRS